MKTIKRNKSGIVTCTILLIVFTVACILGRKVFIDYDFGIGTENGKFAIIEKPKLSFYTTSIALMFLGIIVYFLQMNIRWKLTYSETGFSLKYEDIDWIDFSKIKRIQHYVFHGRRNGSNKFIIQHMGMAEFGVKEELLETTISRFPDNDEMRIFFSTIKENYPQIDFLSTTADQSRSADSDFDFFYQEDDGF